MIKMPAAETGMTITMPAWCILEGIDQLSDEDKTDIATAIVNMIGDGRLALSVLQLRCRHCGKYLGFDYECDCEDKQTDIKN